MKKIVALMLVTIWLAVILSGCGSDEPETLDAVSTDGTAITVSATPVSADARPAIQIGQKTNDALGYRGYCFAVEPNRVVLYLADGKLTELAERTVAGVAECKQLDLKVEIEGKIIRCFLLDDAEGVTPWPEIEMKVASCDGYTVTCVDLAGETTVFKNLKLSRYTPVVYDKTYTNPVYNVGADPDVTYENGTFYLFGTYGLGYSVHTSTDLVHWEERGIAAEDNLWGISDVYWAPDIEKVNGRYYMAATCSENLGFAVSDSLLGPFTAIGDQPLYQKAIDGHIFIDDDGKRYLYYVGYHNYGIYGVELDDNMVPILSTTRLLIQPTDAWEKVAGAITEGPYMLKHNGTYYLMYSGTGYTDARYAVGYAVSSQPLGDYYKYAQNPILIGNMLIRGVGHHSVVTLPETGEMWMVYHCHNGINQVHERKVCIDRMRFAPTGGTIDRIEVYGPTITPQPVPALS